MMKKAAIRKRAQRAYPTLPPCEKCGSTENVQRHHPDHAQPLLVKFLCQQCHTSEDADAGRWGRGKKKLKNCAVCGMEFAPSHSKKHKTCSAECLSAIGRLNALKRWRPGSIALNPSETPSSPKSPNGSAEE
jgi:protein-arginine kinase activator protein McsA